VLVAGVFGGLTTKPSILIVQALPAAVALLLLWLSSRPPLNIASRPSRGLTDVASMMYIHHVTRTQLYLDATMHAHLQRLARKQGRTVSDLVRDALTRAYGVGEQDERVATLRAIEGLWQHRRDIGDTAAYVRGLRRGTRRARRLSG